MTQQVTLTANGSTFTVPAGVTSIYAVVRADRGGAAGGLGGMVRGRMAVTPGEVLVFSTLPGGPGGVSDAGGFTGGAGGRGAWLRRNGSGQGLLAGGGGGGGAASADAPGTYPGGNGGNGGGAGGTGEAGSGNGGVTRGGAGGGFGTSGSQSGAPGESFLRVNNEFGSGGPGGGGGGGANGGGGGIAGFTLLNGSPAGGGGGGGGGGSFIGNDVTEAEAFPANQAGTSDARADIEYNTAPTTPGAFTSPASGQNVSGLTTITWGASSDADGDALVYDVYLTLNGGGSYTLIRNHQPGTSFTYDFTSSPATANAFLHVYAFDTANLQSPVRQSPTFRVNRAPNAPTLTAPVGGVALSRQQVQRFSWTFSDNDPSDLQSRYDLRYRIVGAGAWTEVTLNTTATQRDFPAATFAVGSFEWQVRTYDQAGAVGLYSGSEFFSIAEPPNGPTVLSPANNSTVSSAAETLTWSYPTQQAYQVRKLADLAGAPDTGTVLFDSGIVESISARSLALSFPVNNRVEHLQVRVRDSGLWSPYSSAKVTVSYTPPAMPTLTVTPDDATASIALVYSQATPVPGQPGVTSVDVLRRETAVGGAGIRIAAALPPAGVWSDYTPASAVDYEYALVAVGANGTSTTTAWTDYIAPDPAGTYTSTYQETY